MSVLKKKQKKTKLRIQILPNSILLPASRRIKHIKKNLKIKNNGKTKKLKIQFLPHSAHNVKHHNITWIRKKKPKKTKQKIAKQKYLRRYHLPANIITLDDDVASALDQAGFKERAIERKSPWNDMAAWPSSEEENEKIWERAYDEAKKLPPKGPPIEYNIPNEESIDPLCRPALRELWRKGYRTQSSCQGHEKLRGEE